MDRAVVVGYLLLACVVTLAPVSPPSTAPPEPPPRLLGCLFHQRTNVTCSWEDGGHAGPNATAATTATASYTLLVEKMRGMENLSLIETFSCTTTDTSCTADLRRSNVVCVYCVSVVAGDRRSTRRCQSGRREVVLEPVVLLSVDAVRTRPHCLLLRWDRPASYPLTVAEINNGTLESELELSTQGQVAELKTVNVSVGHFEACLFRPGTSYSLRLRHRLSRDSVAPWSPWSPPCHGSTAEAAPSTAPSFWRRVMETHKNGWKNVSLLWKPLHASVAHGRVLSYNVSCRRPAGAPLADLGSCAAPRPAATSCHFVSPPGTFSCSITATNSAGSSPGAHIWLLSDEGTGLPPPNQITVRPLDDHSLGVRWTAPVDQSVSSFVVDWSAVPSAGGSVYHWERLTASQKELVITDGLAPYTLYTVCVTAVYARRGTGRAREILAYTRQGVPSAGPVVVVQGTLANALQLAWRPIPVEQRHGHVRNYTVYYTRAHGPTMSRTLLGHVLEFCLDNLLPGYYNIHMLASTDAGPGAAGPSVTVTLAYEEVSIGVTILRYLVLTFFLTAGLMLILGVLAHQATLRLRPCQHIPDASKSSVAHWTPSDPTQKTRWPPVMAPVPYSRLEIPLVLEKARLENRGFLCDPADPRRFAPALLGGPAGTPEPVTDYASVVFHQQVEPLWNLLREPQHPQAALMACDDLYTPAVTFWAAEPPRPPLGGAREPPPFD